MSAKISASMRSACYGLARWHEYPTKRTSDALVRRELARWIGPRNNVLTLTEGGRRVAAAYGAELLRISMGVKS